MRPIEREVAASMVLSAAFLGASATFCVFLVMACTAHGSVSHELASTLFAASGLVALAIGLRVSIVAFPLRAMPRVASLARALVAVAFSTPALMFMIFDDCPLRVLAQVTVCGFVVGTVGVTLMHATTRRAIA